MNIKCIHTYLKKIFIKTRALDPHSFLEDLVLDPAVFLYADSDSDPAVFLYTDPDSDPAVFLHADSDSDPAVFL